MSIKLIGITGKKYSGKDTVGKYFVDNHNFKRISIADPLKEACRHIFGFTQDQLHGDNKETIDEFWKVSPRSMFQYIGTDLMRNKISKDFPCIGEDLWIKALERNIVNSIKNGNKVVVTDIRFQNEIDLIRKLGGITIRTKRDMASGGAQPVPGTCYRHPLAQDMGSVNTSDMHESEFYVDTFVVDIDINNNKSIEELYSWISENICDKKTGEIMRTML